MSEEQSAITTRCRESIISNDYLDFWLRLDGDIEYFYELYEPACIQDVNRKYAILHYQDTFGQQAEMPNMTFYNSVPKCYGLMDTSNMEESGILRIRRQPYLNLLGSGVMVGFVDTGIDYQNPIFKNTDRTTRIHSIWDQSIQDGTPPDGFYYGTLYSKEQIDTALASENPLEIVPSIDESGHGTFMAGIASGNIDPANDFTGAAPLSEIVMVKLKQAKEYLRNYYYIPQDEICFQETDIVKGVQYLIDVAKRERKPMAICIGVGTNSGGHAGTGILDEILSGLADETGLCIITSTGNEANSGCHYRGTPALEVAANYNTAEIRVGEREEGFVLEFWANAPAMYSIEIISPGGEIVPRGQQGQNQTFRFIFEGTVIHIDNSPIDIRTGDQLIFMRFSRPTPGLWTLRIYAERSIGGYFDLWLPIRNFIRENTQFIRSDPDVTITDPGNALTIISTAAYNHSNGSIYLASGRGYTRVGLVKPDIAAPGVNIYGPLPGNRFGIMTGTSIAAAHCAGAAALLLEWGIVRGNRAYMDTNEIRKLFILGATREDILYPNREWGYGKIDIYGVFESLRRTV